MFFIQPATFDQPRPRRVWVLCMLQDVRLWAWRRGSRRTADASRNQRSVRLLVPDPFAARRSQWSQYHVESQTGGQALNVAAPHAAG